MLLPFIEKSLDQLSLYNANSSFGDIRVSYHTLALLDDNKCKFATSLAAANLSERMTRQKERLLDVFDKHNKRRENEGVAMSRSEQKYTNLALRALDESYPELTLATNEYLYGFEADIIVRRMHGAKVSTLVIEVDGPSHRRDLTSKHFDVLRDEYLAREHDVIVERWELVLTNLLSNTQIIEKFHNSFDRLMKA